MRPRTWPPKKPSLEETAGLIEPVPWHGRFSLSPLRGSVGLAALNAQRFTATRSADAATMGLTQPLLTVELTGDKAQPVLLTVWDKGPPKTLDRYATASGADSVFVLPADTIKLLDKTADDFVPSPSPPRPAPGGYNMPPMGDE